MSLRCLRPAVRAVLLLLALGAGSATGVVAAGAAPTPSPASGGPSTAAVTLLDQSPAVVQPGPGPGGASPLHLELGVGPNVPANGVVQLTLYRKLLSRTGFQQTVAHGPTGPVLDRTDAVPVRALQPTPGGGMILTTQVVADTAGAAPPATLDLGCTLGSGDCAGVYPLVVTVSSGTGAPLGRFTTYLTYANSRSGQPLRFALVLPLAAPVTIEAKARTAARSLAPLSPDTAAAARGLIASLAQFPSVPVTVQASPQTLQGLARSGPGSATALNRQALVSLGALSADQRLHEIPGQPYVPIDLAALAGAGESTEITGQMVQGAAVLHDLGVSATVSPETWVADTSVGPAIAAGLNDVTRSVGATSGRLVVPDSSVTLPAGQFTWDSTFQLSSGQSQPVAAAATDSGLTSHFQSNPADPALEAQQILADLAVIQSEAPNTPTARGVVAVAPPGWAPTAAFDNELLAGLAANPVVAPVTLDGFFAQVPSSSDPVHLATGSGTVMPPSLAHDLTVARLRLTGFDSAVPAGQPILTQLDQLLLASESSDLRVPQQRQGIAAFERALDGQLRLVEIAAERTITLTARTGPIPVTVLSAAPYPIRGTLTLTSPKLVFPQGPARGLVLDRSTNSVRVPVEVRTSGDLPLTAVFSSPREGLTITRAQMTVRSTATSIVGIVLTIVALVVLLGWWARTVWSGRRRRRAAASRGSAE